MIHEHARRLAIFALALSTTPATAATLSSHDAFALSAIVGGYSPVVGAPQKAALARMFNGHASATDAGIRRISVTADSIVCGAGDVDITRFSCDLKFGARTKHLSGRSAHELFATLGDAGVASDGAMGTIYEGIYALRCTLIHSEIAENGGGGASCTYSPTER